VIVIPAIDLRGGKCVRLVQGDPSQATEYDPDPVAVARRFEAGGARWLHVVDLDAALGSGSNRAVVSDICAAVAIPVQAGGGLRSQDAVEDMLAAGAERAVVGTAAALDPNLLARMVNACGERVVVAVDVLRGRAMLRGWVEEGPLAADLIRRLDAEGCSRYLVTSIDVDGTLAGPDLDLYALVLDLSHAPVLASGGVRSAQDLMALADLGVEGAVVGRALYDGTLTLAEAEGAGQ
jgi:phosphoribosylformimino-5-aminoimidazole carboxamide ribotide isomerase